jgi:hypothetical protein
MVSARPISSGERQPPRWRRPSLPESLPAVALWAAAGLFLCSLANALSRATVTTSQLPFWIGLLAIAVPIFYRLCSKQPTFRQRLWLVLLLGLALYGVKVVHDSLLFTFPDEFVHSYNAARIAEHHHLYHFNPALPVTPRYPGLEGATSALMMLTGMSSYGAGIILVGAARLTFVAALFFFFARLSGSARGAGLGVAIYTGSSNFLFWGAQFSYESLALPLLVVVLMAFVEREAAPPGLRRAWLVPIALGMVAIPITHHLTSYALALTFILLAVLYRVLDVKKPNPWPLALAATATAVGWLLVAARSTVGYLFPVLKDALEAVFETVSGEAAPRTLFHSSSSLSESVGATPLPARAVALLAVALLGVLAFLGLRQLRSRRRDPFVVLLGTAAVVFFGALFLRFAPAAWETGNRAGEFLFIGLAFVGIYGAAHLLDGRSRLPRPQVTLTAGLAVVLVGGAISGWGWDVQLARPMKVDAGGRPIGSEPVALAEFADRRLAGARLAAPEADARMLLSPGRQVAFGGQGPDVEHIVGEPRLAPWMLPVLARHHLPYVVADRRKKSSDTLRGYYFPVPGSYGEELLPAGVVHKFARIPAGRVWDSGRIVLFDLRDRPPR